MLSDKSIREYMKEGKIKVEPCDLSKQLGEIGIDLRLGNTFREFVMSHKPFIDLTKPQLDSDTRVVTIPEGDTFMIHPGEFVLGTTVENVELPNNIAGRLDGRSSLGRLGIIIHATAGHVDPGWKGKLTLEISNIGKLPIALIPGMRFCCIRFEEVSTPVETSYRGKYGSQGSAPPASKIADDFTGDGKATW
jgi:dCTP deaminase